MLRFAITPTDDLNIVQLRTALFNYILSQQTGEELLIRIDDTEKEKNIEKKDKEILELLALFNIEHSRVIIQSENIKYHTGMGMKLLLDKKAFNCFCSDEALDKDKEDAKKNGKEYSYNGFCETISDETKFHCNAPFVVRIKKPENNITFNDLLLGEQSFTPSQVDSFVYLKHDKSPVSDFASAVDDMLYDISTIIQEDIHLEETPKQIHLRDALGYDKQIKYLHMPKLYNLATNQEVSTEDSFYYVKDLIEQGYLPIAIANYIVHLGYNPPIEIFSIEEATEWFDIKKIQKEVAKFDITKLNDLNRKHLQHIDEMRLSKILGFADEDIGKLAKLYLSETYTTKQIKEKIDLIFDRKSIPFEIEKEYKQLQSILVDAPFIKDYKDFMTYIINNTNLDEKSIELPLRYLLTGTDSGPELSNIYALIKNYLGEIITC